ncbi:MAG: Crp/Fnr family transcriptional regulator [Fimbriimonadaceae bacterium]|nr:Crp/Fnr family transcriptional regulator [Fimbriimonadaceae bacterium]
MSVQPQGSALWYIRKLNFFPAMSDDELLACAQRTKMENARRGEALSLPSEDGQYAWLVKEGRVRLLRTTADGRSLALDILGPGEVVGEAAIVGNEGGAEYVEAIEDCILCRVSAEFLRDLCEKNPQLSLEIGKNIGLKRLRIENRLTDMLFCTVPVRVAKVFVQLAAKFGKASGSETLIDLKLTHQDIADLVGANREAVTRAIDKLLDEGIVGYQGRKLVVRQPAELAKIAG